MSAQGGKNSLASGEVWMGKGESMDTGREEESWQHSNILAFKNNILAFHIFIYVLLCNIKLITHNSIITYHEKNFDKCVRGLADCRYGVGAGRGH